MRRSVIDGAVSPQPSRDATRLPAPHIWPLHFGERVVARAMSYALPVTLATLAGLGLRLILLDRFPLREDEAIYAYWALHAWGDDPMFLQVWPDKPPLYLWLLGGAFRLFGVSEASARWLNVACSALLIPVVAATARRTWGPLAGTIAATALALNPYAVSFGATAFTDPLLVLAGTSALCLAVYGRAGAAGLWLGAAVMTKQQGLLFAPLVVGALWATLPRGEPARQSFVRALLRLGAGLALAVAPVLYWDSLRWAVAPSPWDLATRNYAALGLASSLVWPERAAAWGELVWHLAGSAAAWALAAALVAGGLFAGRRTHGRDRLIAVIALWSAAFLLLHGVTTVQAWDRYLLPLAPMLALAVGWGGGRLVAWRAWTLPRAALVIAGALLVWAPPAWRAAVGAFPIGGDHGAYAGLPAAIEQVRTLGGEQYVLYHQALGWHYRFYLYNDLNNALGDARVDLRWFPSTVYLADNAAKTPYPPAYLIEPDWASLPNLAPHMAMRGLALTPRGAFEHFRVWEVTHLPAKPCDWCACRAPVAWPAIAAHGPSSALPRSAPP